MTKELLDDLEKADATRAEKFLGPRPIPGVLPDITLQQWQQLALANQQYINLNVPQPNMVWMGNTSVSGTLSGAFTQAITSEY